jgi:transcriptional regulator with XRE-family HTH domain
MAYPSDFVAWLREELNSRDWSTVDLSKRTGISQAHISRIFSGNRKAGPDALRAIAKALGLPPDFLFRRAGLLPPTKEELDELEQEWNQIFSNVSTDEERKELLDRARFELTRIRERKARYDTGSRQTP